MDDAQQKVTLEMTNEVKAKIVADLKLYLSDEKVQQKMAKNEEFAQMIKLITKNESGTFALGHSPAPVYKYGYVEGDATAVGEQEGYAERTIARGFKSRQTYIYADSDIDPNNRKCNYIAKNILKLDPYWEEDSKALAQTVANAVCESDFGRLNYKIKSCRVNKWSFIETEERVVYRCFPIDATIYKYKKKGASVSRVFLGYFDQEKNETIFDIKVPMSKGKKALLGVILAILAIAAVGAFVYFNFLK